jgi:hypothetical protein
MPPERITSNQTVVHHDSWSEDPSQKDEATKDEQENHVKTQAEARERQIDRIEAQIQAAARAVVASIEQENYTENEESVLSTQTDESYGGDGTGLTDDEGTELTYGDGAEVTYESDIEHHSEHDEGEGDSSSHHDGDIDDDDVFSRDSGHSARSSLDSCHDLHSSDEAYTQKQLISPAVGEEAALEEEPPMSRIPSATSYIQNPPDTTPRTPNKVLNRPPFRTPSSVRAMQMSSPPPSIFSSPRSAKRHLPTVSRLGTPTSHTSKNKTPTRFKVKKEYPLILLHVTVLPLQWPYSHVMSFSDLPASLQGVKESWRMLQEKLGDTVLERGILLPHPQDSYEVLEERLLEALELPVRPCARILKCGHYMGPLDSETPSSDDEAGGYFEGEGIERKWCDICGRDVRLEDYGPRAGETRFRIKIYASNGLMRAGAWAAAWREMERVDVEIEPFVETHLADPLEHLASTHKIEPEAEDEFVDEEEVVEHIHEKPVDDNDEKTRVEDERMRRKAMEEERMREIYGHDIPRADSPRPRTSRRSSSRSSVHGDSLPELLLAAFKVAMRDQKNVAICALSVIVLLLALWPRTAVQTGSAVIRTDPAPVPEVVTHFVTETVAAPKEPIPTAIDMVAEIPPRIPKIVEEVKKETTEPVEDDDPVDKTQTPNSVDAPPPGLPTIDLPVQKLIEETA